MLSTRHSINNVGVNSDTHGLIRAEALSALQGSDVIVHAGDIGSPDVLERLSEIAPVRAVRGNNDREAWARRLPLTDVIEIGADRLYLIHILDELDIDPAAAGFAAVISGHSHKPAAEVRNGVLFLNPGSAGPRRFKLPIAVVRMRLSGTGIEHEIVELGV